MTPPVHEGTLEAVSTGVRRSSRIRFQPGDVVTLADVWAMVAFLWISKIAWNLPNSVGIFAVALFAVVAAPTSERTRLTPSALDDAGAIVRRVCIAFSLAFVVSLITDETLYEIKTLFYVAAPTIPVLLTARFLSYAAERSVRRKHRSRALVVGAGFIGKRVVQTLEEHPEYGLDVVGAVDDDPRFNAAELGTRHLGDSSGLPDLIESHNVDVVIVGFSSGDQAGMVDTIRKVQETGATVWLVPRFFELGSGAKERDHLWGLPIVRLRPHASKRPEWILKRTFDAAVALGALIVAAPVMALVALAVMLESGRPILFRQERIGRYGKPFDILKFRSMAQVAPDTQQTEWCDAAEMRVTKVGKFIRATGLDELPQLINVLRGDMSLVGPRPERPHFVEQFSEQYASYSYRHRLPVGVTGWSQVNGLRGDTSIEERAVFDNYYIENWSFTEDLKIVLRTARALIKQ